MPPVHDGFIAFPDLKEKHEISFEFVTLMKYSPSKLCRSHTTTC
ncbi:MAG: hypothetical protein RLZZ456_698, partial [Pseudomonadota bacterium]